MKPVPQSSGLTDGPGDSYEGLGPSPPPLLILGPILAPKSLPLGLGCPEACLTALCSQLCHCPHPSLPGEGVSPGIPGKQHPGNPSCVAKKKLCRMCCGPLETLDVSDVMQHGRWDVDDERCGGGCGQQHPLPRGRQTVEGPRGSAGTERQAGLRGGLGRSQRAFWLAPPLQVTLP